MRVRFGPVHLSRELPRGHSRAMLASERNALINEIDAARLAVDAAKQGTALDDDGGAAASGSRGQGSPADWRDDDPD
jgi:hypothetical protein